MPPHYINLAYHLVHNGVLLCRDPVDNAEDNFGGIVRLVRIFQVINEFDNIEHPFQHPAALSGQKCRSPIKMVEIAGQGPGAVGLLVGHNQLLKLDVDNDQGEINFAVPFGSLAVGIFNGVMVLN